MLLLLLINYFDANSRLSMTHPFEDLIESHAHQATTHPRVK